MVDTDLGAVNPAFFSGLQAPTRFFFIRHGQSEANAQRIVQGLKDYRLDDAGRAQAAALGLWLKDKGIESLASSPLVRARETAAILADRLSLPQPEIIQDLREIDTGRFSGLSLEESRALYPEDYAAFESLSWEGVPDAERAEAVYARAMRVWSLLRAKAFGGEGRIACVTHGGMLQWLVRATFGTRTWMPLLPTGNCGVFELLVEPVSSAFDGGSPARRDAKLFWERLNFQVPGPVLPVAPVF